MGVVPGMKFCSECGAKLAGEAPKFCGECGHKLEISVAAASPASAPAISESSDEEESLRVLAEAGNTDAMFNLGNQLRNSGDVAGARQW